MSAAALDTEQDDLVQRQIDVHEHCAHPSPDRAAVRTIGSRVRAVDGSVTLAMPPSEAIQRVTIETRKDAAADYSLHGWVVAVGHDVLTLGWAAGSKIIGRLRGSLASDGLSCTAVQLMRSGPAPAAAKPFRLLRVAADRKAKTPETLMIELAGAGDPAAAKTKPDPAPAGTKGDADKSSAKPKVNLPPPGLRIGAAGADGFVPLLEVIPGRGIVMRGNVDEVRRIVRKPPSGEPSDEQLMQAFLRTDAGKKEVERIKAAAEKIVLAVSNTVVTDSAEKRRCDFGWTLTNSPDLTLSRLKVMATLMIRDKVPTPGQLNPAPVWTEMLPPPEKTALAKGESTTGRNTVFGSKPDRTHPSWLGVLIAAESEYGLPVTAYLEQEVA